MRITALRNTLCLFVISGLSCSDVVRDEKEDAALTCECPAVTGDDVSFDNTGSVLASETVQDAINELGEKHRTPVPDITTRIFVEEREVTVGDGSDWLGVDADCPGTTDEVLALGGGCEIVSGPDGDAHLVENRLSALGMQCSWRKPRDIEYTVKARVSCMTLKP